MTFSKLQRGAKFRLTAGGIVLVKVHVIGHDLRSRDVGYCSSIREKLKISKNTTVIPCVS